MAELKLEVLLPEKSYNLTALDKQLRDELGDQIAGVTARKGRYFALLTDLMQPGSEGIALGVAALHNAAELTAEQQAKVERAQKLDAAVAKLESADVKPASDVRTVGELAAVVEHLQTQLEWALIKIHDLTGEALPEKKADA